MWFQVSLLKNESFNKEKIQASYSNLNRVSKYQVLMDKVPGGEDMSAFPRRQCV